MRELTPQQKKAKELLEREFEEIGLEWHNNADHQFRLLSRYRDHAELYKLAGFGDAPEFAPSRPRFRPEQLAS